MKFATMSCGVTPAASAATSRLCEIFEGAFHEISGKNRATRLGGIPAGSLEVTWEVEDRSVEDWSRRKSEQKLVQRVVSLSGEITQTSEGFLVLQSITCSRTSIEPVSRWARGAVFWADSEARVQTAPSGIMKARKDGFSMLTLLFGVGVALLSKGIGGEFFRVMSSIVSFVSSAVIFCPSKPTRFSLPAFF
jgi:hypothetical protein